MLADSVKSYNNNQIEEFIAFLRDNKENIPSILIALVDGSVLAISIFETPEFEKELRKILQENLLPLISVKTLDGEDITNKLTRAPKACSPEKSSPVDSKQPSNKR